MALSTPTKGSGVRGVGEPPKKFRVSGPSWVPRRISLSSNTAAYWLEVGNKGIYSKGIVLPYSLLGTSPQQCYIHTRMYVYIHVHIYITRFRV